MNEQRESKTDSSEERTELIESESCKHHWEIKPANGPTSDSTCILCGETKEHANSDEFHTFKQTSKRIFSKDSTGASKPIVESNYPSTFRRNRGRR